MTAKAWSDPSLDPDSELWRAIKRERAERPALLEPFPGAGEPSPIDDRVYPLDFDESEHEALTQALYLLLRRCRETGDLTHVPHAQAVLKRLYDDMHLNSFYSGIGR